MNSSAKITKSQIKGHIKVARFLEKIINEAFRLIEKRKNCTEYEVQQFILSRFDYYKLATDKDRTPIVAFGRSTANVHYYPPIKSSRRVRPESLIMIDVWARLAKGKNLFADLTWMAYYGKKIPREIKDIFKLVVSARDNSIKAIRSSLRKDKLPIARSVDLAARDIISQKGHGKKFLHTTGHSLGFSRPHGAYKGINTKNNRPLKINLPYTIEPGIYLKEKFGVRSEICFYIREDFRLIITSRCQRKLVLLS